MRLVRLLAAPALLLGRAGGATLSLDGADWSLRGASTLGDVRVPATVPGGVWDNLHRAGRVGDPLYRDNPSRVENRKALGAIMAGIFGAMTRAEAIAKLEASKLAWSNVSSVEDLSGHAALRRIVVETPGGSFDGVASPVRRTIKGGPVPALGAHTDELRTEFAETGT